MLRSSESLYQQEGDKRAVLKLNDTAVQFFLYRLQSFSNILAMRRAASWSQPRFRPFKQKVYSENSHVEQERFLVLVSREEFEVSRTKGTTSKKFAALFSIEFSGKSYPWRDLDIPCNIHELRDSSSF
uniref:Uncharacterized protein n=1 Tax=Paracidobacterium acidisoli TaxID=2303751 RepID=A0A372IR06_9BACT